MVVDQFRRARNLEDPIVLPLASTEEYCNKNQYHSIRRPSSEWDSSVKHSKRNILQRLHGRIVSVTCMDCLIRNTIVYYN